MNITGNIALVTGGASGLGLATARRLHAGGAWVVILDLPGSNGLAVGRELEPRVAFCALKLLVIAAILLAVLGALTMVQGLH